MVTDIARRPLSSRDTSWARAIAGWLALHGVTPNTISCASVGFAGLAAGALYLTRIESRAYRVILLLVSAACFQCRLLCNLFDGMVAIEGGYKTKSGEIFNELPDRIADGVIFVGSGFVAAAYPFGTELGWLATALAIFTAYVRMLGASCGLKQNFMGPMAKQQRMAVMTVAAVVSIYETRFADAGATLWAALVVINVGCIVTLWKRTARIVQELEAR